MTQPRLDADPEAPGPLIPQKPLCAAREPKELMFNCPNIVNRVCQACQLVSYCRKKCQRDHKDEHKKDCEHEFLSYDWKPELEGLDESTITEEGRNIWGRLPGPDIFQIEHNEGLNYDKHFAVCYAAAEDLRGIIKSINILNPGFKHCVTLVINDENPRLMARNFLTLMVASLWDQKVAPDMLVHLWYSGFVDSGLNSVLCKRIRLRVSQVVKTARKGVHAITHETWHSCGCRISARFSLAMWEYILAMLDPNAKDNDTKVDDLENCSGFSPAQHKHRDAYIYRHEPSQRLSVWKFLNRKTLLPFGETGLLYSERNPTLFYIKSKRYLPNPDLSPLESWPLFQVLESGARHDVPKNDTIGALFFHMLDFFNAFCLRTNQNTRDESLPAMDYYLYNVNPMELQPVLTKTNPGLADSSFDRIDVADLTDKYGLLDIVRAFTPLLKPQEDNLHATLVMLTQATPEDIDTFVEKDCKDHNIGLRPKTQNSILRLVPIATAESCKDMEPWDAFHTAVHDGAGGQRYVEWTRTSGGKGKGKGKEYVAWTPTLAGTPTPAGKGKEKEREDIATKTDFSDYSNMTVPGLYTRMEDLNKRLTPEMRAHLTDEEKVYLQRETVETMARLRYQQELESRQAHELEEQAKQGLARALDEELDGIDWDGDQDTDVDDGDEGGEGPIRGLGWLLGYGN